MPLTDVHGPRGTTEDENAGRTWPRPPRRTHFHLSALYAIANDGAHVGVFILSPGDHTARQLSLDLTSLQQNQGSSNIVFHHVLIAGGWLFLTYEDSIGQTHNTVFDLRTGQPAHQLDTDNMSIPAVVGDQMYCVNFARTGDTFLTAFSLRDGARIWQQPIALDPFDHNGLDSIEKLSVAAGLVYVSTFDHTLSCFDATTGSPKWHAHLTGEATAPVIAGETVYIGVWDGSIIALDAVTGNQRWQAHARENIAAAPTISNDTLYIGSLDGYLYALDAGSGTLYWRSVLGDESTNPAPFEINTRPVVYRNVVAVASGGYLFAYDLRDGSSRWRFTPIPDQLNALFQPVLANGLVLVGSGDGKVYALNP